MAFVFFLPCSGYAYEVAPNGAITASTCNGGTLPICGVRVPMPATTSIGNTAEVHVPPALLGNPSKIMSFSVECVDNGYGGGSYQLVGADRPDCNAFPCQTSSVRLCDTNIEVPGGTPLGGTVEMKMPGTSSPAASFTVQCVGSGGAPPVYQISDHSAVTCPAAAQ